MRACKPEGHADVSAGLAAGSDCEGDVIDPTRTYTPEEAERIFEEMDAYFVKTTLEWLAIAFMITVALFAVGIGIEKAKEWWDNRRHFRR